VLNRQLALLGMSREDFWTTNSMWCLPKHLGWTDYPNRFKDAGLALEHCKPYLDDLIESVRPRAFVPCGNVALRRLCQLSGIEAHAGYVLPTPYGIPAVPMPHPSFVMKGNQKLNSLCLYSLGRALEIANGTYRPSLYTLHCDPAIAVGLNYLNSAGPTIDTLVVDIETPESDRLDEEELEGEGVSWTIVRAGFSLAQGTAISFPWQEPYIDLLRQALKRATVVVEHADNHFDTKRLAKAGLTWTAKVVSSMWAWHFLESDLPKGLGKVAPFFYSGPPWKHLSQAEPARYNAMDNAVTMDCYLGTRDTLAKAGRWDSFMRHCVDMADPLTVMGQRGVRIDTEFQAQFMSRLEREWDESNAKLQAMVPESLKKVKRWKRAPKDMTGVKEIINEPTQGAAISHSE
jgi:uracil-DNA glycosylase family 4